MLFVHRRRAPISASHANTHTLPQQVTLLSYGPLQLTGGQGGVHTGWHSPVDTQLSPITKGDPTESDARDLRWFLSIVAAFEQDVKGWLSFLAFQQQGLRDPTPQRYQHYRYIRVVRLRRHDAKSYGSHTKGPSEGQGFMNMDWL